jgi:glycosyltransferase involved in cell wall biosynthesis
VIGDGSLSEKLRGEVVRLGLDRNVHFTGFVRDVAPWMSLLRVNVNCSIGTETSSLALSEGMSLGIPALASDYGGNPYMVRNGENGFLYPQGDDARLAALVERLVADEVLYVRLSEGAYRRFREELNVEKMTKETEELYEKLLCLKIEVKCRAERWQY